jgi:Protein of unknown function (DUF3105)
MAPTKVVLPWLTFTDNQGYAVPKSKRRKKSTSASSRPLPFSGSGKDKATRRINLILVGIAAIAIVGAGAWWWQSQQVESRFLALVAEGQPALENVKSLPDRGNNHLTFGQTPRIGTPFPTSGTHESVSARAGFYTQSRRPAQVLHSLEHGNVAIYYDDPGEEVLATLKDWAGIYGGQFDGILVLPGPSLGRGVVLTAWTKMLRLDPFDPAAAAAFIDAYRGRGPEATVR